MSDVFTAEDEPVKCPHCGVSLLALPIPEQDRHRYGGAFWFKREIAQYDIERARSTHCICPDCGGIV